MQLIELSEQQHLNLVDSTQLYRAWDEARNALVQYKYGMRWVSSKGKRYLVRLKDAEGRGRSLGAESEKTQEILKKFGEGKLRARERYKGLSERLKLQSRLNRALRLGRIPGAAASLLAELNKSRLSNEFLIVGTHALFAYEAMAGVHIESGLLATTDFDLCFDARRPLKLVLNKMHSIQANGLLGLLQKIDKSYEPLQAHNVFRAVNQDGFMVDIITPERGMEYSFPVTFGTDDLIAAEVPKLHWLLNAPKCGEVVIAHNGTPVFMQVPDPRAFALHKAWLSQHQDRNPSKRMRDKAQARTVVALVEKYLPNLPFTPAHLKYLSKDMLQTAIAALPPSKGLETLLGELKLRNS